jgi:hypothetical protein
MEKPTIVVESYHKPEIGTPIDPERTKEAAKLVSGAADPFNHAYSVLFRHRQPRSHPGKPCSLQYVTSLRNGATQFICTVCGKENLQGAQQRVVGN